MMLNDYGKLILFLSSIVAMVVLGIFHVVDDKAIIGIIGAIVGYATGNGRLAVRGENPSVLIAPKAVQDRRTPAAADDPSSSMQTTITVTNTPTDGPADGLTSRQG